MNYLAHLLLAGDNKDHVVGGLLGDFVRGRVNPAWPRGLREGVILHRRIDSFTDAHLITRTSRRRFSPPYRRYSGIILDVLFDHYLASSWSEFGHIPLSSFLSRTYRVLEGRLEYFEGRGRRVVTAMIEDDWLGSYRERGCIEPVLKGISRRVRRDNPLPRALPEVDRLYETLREDFRRFFPLAMDYASATGLAIGEEVESGAVEENSDDDRHADTRRG